MSDLTPAESEAVRRLLADARTDEPMPTAVAARLDGVLAGLTADRTAPDAPPPSDDTDDADEPVAPVVPLHRRRWPQVLVAAAAVTALAFGTTQVLRDSQGGDAGGSADNAPASAESADAPESPAEAGAPSEGAGNGAESGREPSPTAVSPEYGDDASVDGVTPAERRLTKSLSGLGVRRLVPVRPGAQFDASVTELLNESRAGALTTLQATRALRICGPFYSVDGARFFVATYRGHVALVLAHPEMQGRRLVEVYDCEAPAPRRTVELVTLTDGE